jgi:splicing factor U2AF 65 kDa subunit
LVVHLTDCIFKQRDERRDRGDRGDRDRGERRRSRSPRHGSGRSSRREPEADSYSSSRDYRAREREDRYSSNRRDDREWDRDRGDRRRRDFDERPARRERGDRGDLFEERPRRREREGRGDREQERRRSTSPPKRKEPTPDLTDVVSILERKRRLTQWDIKPPGYDNVTSEQAKLSGMFPLPGAPRQQAVDPSRLQAFVNQPSGTSTDNAALKPANSRQAKRLFAHNIPPNVNDAALTSFFNLQLNGLNVIQGIDPCVSAQISKDRSFALLEFKSPDEATVALAFDGITMEEHEGADTANGGPRGLELRRPKDYIVPSQPEDQQHYQEGVISNQVPDSPHKLCVTNIPLYIPEEPVTMLLKSIGELKAFILFKDSGTEESRVSHVRD